MLNILKNMPLLQSPTTSYVLVRPSAGLLFPAVDYLRIYLLESLTTDREKVLKTFKNWKTTVLDCGHIDRIDFTAAQVKRCCLSTLNVTFNFFGVLF